jgi:hypothetical protein
MLFKFFKHIIMTHIAYNRRSTSPQQGKGNRNMNLHAKKIFSTFLAATSLIMGSYVAVMAEASENQPASPLQLEQITVLGTTIDGDGADSGAFVVPFDIMTPSNHESYMKKSVEAFGKQGNINVLKILEMSASINYTAADAPGTNEGGFHDPIRVRGNKQTGPGR